MIATGFCNEGKLKLIKVSSKAKGKFTLLSAKPFRINFLRKNSSFMRKKHQQNKVELHIDKIFSHTSNELLYI